MTIGNPQRRPALSASNRHLAVGRRPMNQKMETRSPVMELICQPDELCVVGKTDAHGGLKDFPLEETRVNMILHSIQKG